MPETKTQTETTEEKQPFLGLSLTQLVGGGAAAATAALLGSRLGTTGTIIGAAVASIVSAVASALYTASLARTRQVVVATREILPTTMTLRQRGDLPHVADQPEGSPESDVADVADHDETADPDAETSLWSRIRWKPVLLATAAVFVVGALLITGIEAVTGQSLSGSGRSTFDSVTHTGKQPTDEATQTPSETPSEDTSSDTASTTPTPSESSSPTDVPTDEPSDDPTENQSVSPTPTPSGVPTATPTE